MNGESVTNVRASPPASRVRSGEFQPMMEYDVTPEDSASQIGVASGSSRVSRSSISSARIAEEQRKAVLSLKKKALQKRRELELAKLNLRLQEEQFQLDTEIEICEAKTDILNKLEECSLVTVDEDGNVSQNCYLPPESTHIAEVVKNINTSELRPGAPSFVPGNELDTSNIGIINSGNHGNKSHENLSSKFNANVSDYVCNENVDDCTANHTNKVPYTPTSTKCKHGTPTSSSDISQYDFSQAVVRHLRKPQAEIMKFSGNPLEYQRFIRQFNAKIVANTDDDEERLNYLEQYTIGEAHKIVSGCGYLSANVGYKTALMELEERYGNNEVLANAFIKRALEWPVIKADNAKALDEFSIFLVECNNAIKCIEAVRVLQYPDNLKKLVGKLPFHMHDRWRNVVYNERGRGNEICFSKLVDFVKVEARKVNDPTYGKEAMKVEPKQAEFKPKNGRSVPTRSRGSYATKVDVSDLPFNDQNNEVNINTVCNSNVNKGTAFTSPCLYCNGQNHSLDSCNKLHALPYDDKIGFLKVKGLCFGCLKLGHQSKECHKKLTCKYCKGRHPSVCHVDNKPTKSNRSEQNVQSAGKPESESVTSACAKFSCNGGQYTRAGVVDYSTMAIIPVTVKMNNSMNVCKTYAFLDPGSSASFVTESLLHKIGGYGKPMKITLDTMGTPHTMKTLAVNGLVIGDMNMQNSIRLPKVYTKDRMPVSTEHIPTTADISHWPHLKGIQLPTIQADVGLLIGNNVPDAYTPLTTKTGPRGSPHVTKSLLGWIAWNVVRSPSASHRNKPITVNRTDIIAVQELRNLEQMERCLIQSFNFDFPERLIDDKREPSLQDKLFLDKVNDSIKQVDGHYCIDLPFKKDDVILPNNESQARQRLKSLRNKMVNNPKFHKDYVLFMTDIIDHGYAELVPSTDLSKTNGKVWYIPHHGIYHPHKPDKIRVVFDCAANFEGISLNSLLLQGPNLANNLLAVLLGFRQEEVAIIGDIESMFFQVKVPSKDSDCLRFLWWPEGDLNKEPATYRMVVHLFGAASSPSCCNAALLKTAEDYSPQFDSQVGEVIRRNFYVDDCVKSVRSEAEAISLIHQLSKLCQLGGFRLTKWSSSSKTVLESVPEEDRAKEVKRLDLDSESLPNERVLGIHWSAESDTIGFSIKLKQQPLTKRGILSVTSSIYDPLGIASPFVLVAKILLQELCKRKIGWDDLLPDDCLRIWQTWVADLPRLEELQTARCYKPDSFGEISSCQVHTFCDASQNGYGVAIYLRLENTEGKAHCCLIMGKSRVVPLKKISIPRLELTAATVAVRLTCTVINEIDYHVDLVYYWTDSMSTIRYIWNDSTRFHTFVANRLAVIRDASEPNQWKHVKSESNPADCASRGLHMDKFLNKTEWLKGPSFLYCSEKEWPEIHLTEKSPPIDDPEVKQVKVNAAVEIQDESFLEIVINRHSEWNKLKRVMAWVIFAVDKFKQLRSSGHRLGDRNTKPLINNVVPKEVHLSEDVLHQAEMTLVKHIQNQCFATEIESLTSTSQVKPKSLKTSSVCKLDPFVDGGILRVGGRLSQSDIPYDARHPIILPKKSRVSDLYLKHIHRTVGHLGKNTMLAALRQKYWIIGAAGLIKTLVSKCVTCSKYQARQLEQKMSDLPSDRVTSADPPFTKVGMDYFGPFEVKRGRSVVKRYGVIFTCLSSRAVHLELAHSLTTDSCINSIRRFISRRGPVKVIRSDNGTNLVGSERELREEIQNWNQSKIHSNLQQRNVEWIFNPPAGSHHGGVWERLIRITRKILYSLLRQQGGRMDDESLTTLFCEAESILNGRPITEVSSDYRDLEALTPNHLLLMRTGEVLPPGGFRPHDNYATRRWKQIQYLADVFWSRWTKEYLPLLQSRQKWLRPKRNLKINDLVLVVDNSPRHSWCLGRITDIHRDKKGFVSCKILGLTILAVFFLATFITTGVISYINGFKPFDARPDFMDKMYVKPWCRIGPYLAGMLVGYILFKTKCKAKLRWSTVVLGWCFAIVACLATLYGLYGESHGNPLTNEASAVYNALHRTAWGAGLGWLLFACITGYGGIINIFLSWKAFIPLARLTYMTYLIHLMIITYFNNTAQGPFYMTDITISYMFVGNLVFTYLVAFLISLSFEAPFVGLERVIFRRNR